MQLSGQAIEKLDMIIELIKKIMEIKQGQQEHYRQLMKRKYTDQNEDNCIKR